MDEQLAQYFSLYFWMFWITVHSSTPPTLVFPFICSGHLSFPSPATIFPFAFPLPHPPSSPLSSVHCAPPIAPSTREFRSSFPFPRSFSPGFHFPSPFSFSSSFSSPSSFTSHSFFSFSPIFFCSSRRFHPFTLAIHSLNTAQLPKPPLPWELVVRLLPVLYSVIPDADPIYTYS